MGEPRNHHYISQCYLKRFTRNGSKNSSLHAVDILSHRYFETTPRNVGAQRDFNYIEGLPRDALEQALGKFETSVDKFIQKIVDSGNLDDEESRINVLNLICLFATRNPRLRENIRDFKERTAFMALKVTLGNPRIWESRVKQMIQDGVWDRPPQLSREYLLESLGKSNYQLTMSTTEHIQMEFKLFNSLLPSIINRQWSLCIAPPDSGGFLTSDHPVCLMWSDGSPSDFQKPVGFGLTGTTILFPLAHNLLMVGVFDGQEGERNLTPYQVAYFNAMIASHAERQIYAASHRALLAVQGRSAPIRLDELPEYFI